MTMSPETLAALKSSIQHWKENIKAEYTYEVSVSCRDCALCGLYINAIAEDTEVGCTGCPISENTGLENCAGTPYTVAADLYGEWLEVPKDSREYIKARNHFRSAARAELKFLKSLLPAKNPTLTP